MKFTSASAKKSIDIEKWVIDYLSNTEYGENIPLVKGIIRNNFFWKGPLEFNLNLVKRSCGPEPEMIFRQDPEGWDKRVDKIITLFNQHVDLPPLVIEARETELYLADGAHRHEALRRMEQSQYWVIFFSEQQERLEFLAD